MAESAYRNGSFDWRAWLAKNGFAAVLVMLLLVFIREDVVKPQREDQHAFMEAVIETNKSLALTMSKQADTSQRQAMTSSQQARTLAEISALLKDIRDDQRHGVWRSTVPPKPSELPQGVEPRE